MPHVDTFFFGETCCLFGSSRPSENQTPLENAQLNASVNRIRYETDSRTLKRLGGVMLKDAVAAGILQKDENDDILPGFPVNGYRIGWVDLDSQTLDRPCTIVMLLSDEGKRSYL